MAKQKTIVLCGVTYEVHHNPKAPKALQTVYVTHFGRAHVRLAQDEYREGIWRLDRACNLPPIWESDISDRFSSLERAAEVVAQRYG